MIIVTGASRGIGLAISNRLNERGEEVLGISRNAIGSKFETKSIDVTDFKSIKNLSDEIRLSGKKVTAVINAAGIASMNLALMANPLTSVNLVNVNFLGTVYSCQTFAPLLIRNGGGSCSIDSRNARKCIERLKNLNKKKLNTPPIDYSKVHKLFLFLFGYSIVFTFILVISLFKSSYDSFQFLPHASFQASDMPWLPVDENTPPLIGAHYFGDFYLPFTFVNYANPYSPTTVFNLILPFGQIPFQSLGILGMNFAFTFFILFSLATMFFGIRKILRNTTTLNKIETNLLSTFLIVFSFPIITAIDRGAYVLLVSALASYILAVLTSEKKNSRHPILMSFLLAFIVSAKLYLLPILIFVWLFYSKKLAVVSLFVFFATNLILSFQYGGPMVVVNQMKFALEGMSAATNPEMLLGSLSFSGLIAQTLNSFGLFPSNRILITALSFLPGAVFLCLTILTCKKLKVDINLVYLLGLSVFQYVSPVSYVYTGIWATISSAFLIKFYLVSYAKEDNLLLYAVTFGICSQTLPLHILDTYRTVIPLCWFVTVIFTLFYFFCHRNIDSGKQNSWRSN
jgi:hypothetical protein